MTLSSAATLLADTVARVATHPVGVASIALAEAVTPPQVSTNSVLITLAIGILGWQMRKLLAASEKQTEELIRLRMTVQGDGQATHGVSGDVQSVKASLQDLARKFDELQENRQEVMLEHTGWRRVVDMWLQRLSQGEYQPDNRSGLPGRRATDFLGPTGGAHGE